MAADVPARLKGKRPPGRRFGLELGAAAVVVGALLLRQHRGTAAVGALVLAVILLGVAIGRPAALDPLARRWRAFAAALARVTTPLMLALLYFVILTPMAFLRRTFGTSPFARDRRAESFWTTPTSRSAEEQRTRMERPF